MVQLIAGEEARWGVVVLEHLWLDCCMCLWVMMDLGVLAECEPAMCPSGQESQEHPGLYQRECSQQEQEVTVPLYQLW